MWAFALNRITAIGLTVFLYLHLVMLSKLASGEQVYNDFVTVSKTPLFVFGELLVVIAGLYHGLNGLRVAMTSLGIAVPYQKYLFVILTILALAAGAVFAIRMFSV